MATKKGMIPQMGHNFKSIFRWKIEVYNTEDGEEYVDVQTPRFPANPISLFAKLNWKAWLFFLVGLAAWTADAFDFHALSIQTTKLAEYYKTDNTTISTAITLTLLLRSIGAFCFGMAGDYFGRKWPMVINMVILGVLQIATIFCKTLGPFFAVRSLFGLFMGGVYGNAVAMALEHCPTEARGLMSGILQQGYALGYVFAACANLGVGGKPETFKTVFWVGAGASLGVGFVRFCFPESKQFLETKEKVRRGEAEAITAGDYLRASGKMARMKWAMFIYCIILMTWFNFLSHTTQDSYTTFMKQSKGLDNAAATRASIWMKTGACIGGTFNGYMSQWFGRRRTIILCAFMTCCLIAPWILPNTEAGLSVSGFAIQFFVQGAFGVIPIHLNELAPPEFRSTFPGLSYQIGNMISSPSAQIVNAIAEKIYVSDAGGPHVKGYGPTMAVATAIIAVGIMATAALGPERFGRNFEAASVAGAKERGELGSESGDLEMKASDSSPASSSKKADARSKHSEYGSNPN